MLDKGLSVQMMGKLRWFLCVWRGNFLVCLVKETIPTNIISTFSKENMFTNMYALYDFFFHLKFFSQMKSVLSGK